MANGNKEYIVKSSSLYLRVNGKLQEMKQGEVVKLAPESASGLMQRNLVAPKGVAKAAVEAGKKDD